MSDFASETPLHLKTPGTHDDASWYPKGPSSPFCIDSYEGPIIVHSPKTINAHE